MITKETIKEHISTVLDGRERHNQDQKNSKLNKKTLINESIPLSNRFNPMDIEDPDERTTYIKTNTIKL